jgi:hypothetical protein
VIYRIKNKYNLLATRGIQIDVVNFYGCLLKALNLLQLFEFFYRWRLLLKRSKQFKAAFKMCLVNLRQVISKLFLLNLTIQKKFIR